MKNINIKITPTLFWIFGRLRFVNFYLCDKVKLHNSNIKLSFVVFL